MGGLSLQESMLLSQFFEKNLQSSGQRDFTLASHPTACGRALRRPIDRLHQTELQLNRRNPAYKPLLKMNTVAPSHHALSDEHSNSYLNV